MNKHRKYYLCFQVNQTNELMSEKTYKFLIKKIKNLKICFKWLGFWGFGVNNKIQLLTYSLRKESKKYITQHP